MNGVGPTSSVCPPKHRETKLFGGMSRDFARHIPGAPEKLSSRKKICVQFSSPSFRPFSRSRKIDPVQFKGFFLNKALFAYKNGRCASSFLLSGCRTFISLEKGKFVFQKSLSETPFKPDRVSFCTPDFSTSTDSQHSVPGKKAPWSP